MLIRNEVEKAVTAEVEIRRAQGPGHGFPCWCALCEADVSALAMTVLPPRYSTATEFSLTRGNAVSNAVMTSMRRVAKRPKHPHSAPERHVARVRLVNIAYEEGSALVSGLSRRPELPCTCRECLADTLAFALNRYPPKYGVLHGGRENLPSWQRDLIRHELRTLVTHAAGRVASQPRHRGAALR